MKKIIYAQMVSLDGYIEGPNGGLDWSAPGDELHKHFNDLYLDKEIVMSLYGRRLFENMAAYWPGIDEHSPVPGVEKEFARLWKQQPKIVFSKTLHSADWNTKLAREVDPMEIRKLKQQPGKYIEVGGASLAASFLRHDLIDEFWLYIHPVVLGGGKPYFPADIPVRLKLLDTLTFPCKVVRLRYERFSTS